MQFKSFVSLHCLLPIFSIANAAPINIRPSELGTIPSGSALHFSQDHSNDGSIVVSSDPKIYAFKDGELVEHKTGKSISLDSSNYLIERDQKSNFGFNYKDDLILQDGESYPTDGEDQHAENIICEEGCDFNYNTQTSSADAHSSTTITPSESVSSDDYFGVLTIRSSSVLQYNSIMKVNSHPHVFSVGGIEGTEVEFKLSEDGTLVDQDNLGIYVDEHTGEVGIVSSSGVGKPSIGFSIENDNLIYNGNNFLACPSGKDIYSLSVKDCEGGLGIALHVVKPQNS